MKVHEGAADCVLLELAKFSARPTIHNKYLQVSGHLFDKPMFNKILDVLVCGIAFMKQANGVWLGLGPGLYLNAGPGQCKHL